MRSLNEKEILELQKDYLATGHKLLIMTRKVEINSVIKLFIHDERYPAANIQTTTSGGAIYNNFHRFCHFEVRTNEEDYFEMVIATDTEQVAADLAESFSGSVVERDDTTNLYHVVELPDETSVYGMILRLRLDQFGDLTVVYDALIIKNPSIKYGKLW